MTEARDAAPDSVDVRRVRAWICLSLGDFEDALPDLDFVAGSDGGTPHDWLQRGQTLVDLGRYREALSDYRRAIASAPDDGIIHNSFAWLLATCPEDSIRDGPEAVRLARRACELTAPENDYAKGTLAAAYAECGNFAEAVRWEELAQSLMREADRSDWGFLLDLYRAGRPYRSSIRDSQDRIRRRRLTGNDVGGRVEAVG